MTSGEVFKYSTKSGGGKQKVISSHFPVTNNIKYGDFALDTIFNVNLLPVFAYTKTDKIFLSISYKILFKQEKNIFTASIKSFMQTNSFEVIDRSSITHHLDANPVS